VDMPCKFCGVVPDTSGTYYHKETCIRHPRNKEPWGWLCPRCGNSVAPGLSVCAACFRPYEEGGVNITVTNAAEIASEISCTLDDLSRSISNAVGKELETK